jgi:sigma-E factor negative regulatory protein RseB
MPVLFPLKFRPRPFAACLLLLLFSPSLWAGNFVEGREWLERMSTAMSQMSYQGTFVYSRGDSLETMRITHIVDDSGVQERLYAVSGPQREVIRDKDGVRCVLSDDQSIVEDPVVAGDIFPGIPLDVLGEEDTQYRIQVGGISRIAGQTARKVSIKPVDEFRYGYSLWLEQYSGLLLKWVLHDNEGNALAKLMFTELNLGNDIHEEELISQTPSEHFVKLETGMPDRESLTRTTPRWKPASLPPGFKLASHSVQQKQGKSVFEHQVYSDGLASVSVYIEDVMSDQTEISGASRIGTAHAYSRNVGDKQITVIGEVPSVTVLSIGNSVTPPASTH